MLIKGDFFSFEIDGIKTVDDVQFIDVTARYIPGEGAFGIVCLNGAEAWRGEFMGIQDAFEQGRRVRDAIIHSALKAGLYVNRNNGHEKRTSFGHS